jgi:hypothetical protein
MSAFLIRENPLDLDWSKIAASTAVFPPSQNVPAAPLERWAFTQITPPIYKQRDGDMQRKPDDCSNHHKWRCEGAPYSI